MLPNPYNVYLHSTPAQALFGESRRDFSHGCVRVSDPVGLAQYVLRDSPEWTRERILAAMNDGADSFTVPLKTPIRVFIVYGTVLATRTMARFCSSTTSTATTSVWNRRFGPRPCSGVRAGRE